MKSSVGLGLWENKLCKVTKDKSPKKRHSESGSKINPRKWISQKIKAFLCNLECEKLKWDFKDETFGHLEINLIMKYNSKINIIVI